MPIKKCNNACEHAYQDRIYGGKRVVTELAEGKGYRCTVCGKDILGSISKKGKKK